METYTAAAAAESVVSNPVRPRRRQPGRLLPLGFSRQEHWSGLETYITACKIDSQWEFAAWLRKLTQGLCISLEGWGGEGGSKGRRRMYPYG